MQDILALVTHPIFLSVLLAYIVAQTTKLTILYIKEKKLHSLIKDGNMPSSHSAAVSALIAAVYAYEGVTSLLMVSGVLWFIVIRDALGVRYQVGLHAQHLNKLAKKTVLKPYVGHTPLEVLVGCIVGVLATVVIFVV